MLDVNFITDENLLNFSTLEIFYMNIRAYLT